MKNFPFYINPCLASIFIIGSAAVSPPIPNSAANDLFTITIANVKDANAKIYVGFYKKTDKFLEQKQHSFNRIFTPKNRVPSK